MQFLSTEWFTKVSELRAAAAPLEIPSEIADSIINVTLTDLDGGKNIHIAAGEFVEGHNEKAEVTIGLTSGLLRKLFLELDTAAGMAAFMAGEIKVDGDLSKLMALQSYQPDEKQKALLDQIVAITE